MDKDDESYSEKDAARRRDEALKRMLNTPPTPHTAKKAKPRKTAKTAKTPKRKGKRNDDSNRSA